MAADALDSCILLELPAVLEESLQGVPAAEVHAVVDRISTLFEQYAGLPQGAASRSGLPALHSETDAYLEGAELVGA